MQAWLKYFEHNRENRHSVPWERGITIEPCLRAPLIRSLQKFQLGESGEGRKIRRLARATGDPIYALAMELFVKEEQEHSRLMAEILRQLNAPLLKSDWTDRCFVFLRRVTGLHLELMVLLLPEMIAKCYFRALRDGIDDPVLKSVFGQIAQDEEGHLAFHIEYLRRAFESISFRRRILLQVFWRMVYRATCLVVMFDHRAVLKAVGMKRSVFWKQCGTIFDEVAASIFSPSSVLAPTTLLTHSSP